VIIQTRNIRNNTASTVEILAIYHVRQKTALFYFCNGFVKTLSITTTFGTHQKISYYPYIPHSLYIQRREIS